MLATEGGSLPILPMQTVLVPAAARAWQVRSASARLDLLVASPRF